MLKIKIGDTVIAIAGRDKGAIGVLKTRSKDGRYYIVEGVQMVSKHVRPNPQQNEKGGIVKRESKIHASNIAIYNPTTKKADRVGIKGLEDGRQVRVFKSNNEQIDV